MAFVELEPEARPARQKDLFVRHVAGLDLLVSLSATL